MKKKLAVYGNGWNRESLFSAIDGIKEYGKKEDFDVFVFMSHASYSVYSGINEGELNIYELGDMRDFDGVIVFSGMLNSDGLAEKLCRRAKENHVPVVSVGVDMEGIPFVGMENDTGMRQLVTHLVEQHNVKRVVFIGGTEDHVDSIARLRITREVLEEHGLQLDPKDIYYGFWGYETTMEIIDRLLESEEGLPDAIVCANDYMALAAGVELVGKGKRLPEDVLVTGFDHVREGEIFYPALTTVSQNFHKIGYECCRILLEQQAETAGAENAQSESAREIPKVRIPTEMIRGESCGCPDSDFYKELHRDYCRHSYQSTLEIGLLDQREWFLQSQFTNGVDSYATLKKNLQICYARNHKFEGKSFGLILDPVYMENCMLSESEIWEQGWKEEMQVLVSLKNGQVQDCESVSRHTLIPGYTGTEEGQQLYFIFPLHSDRNNYGYMIFGDDTELFDNNKLYSYAEKMQENLKSLRTNLRLDDANRMLKQIYDKDAMTGLYNRLVYEDKAAPLFERCRENNTSMMVMFVDINYLKRINDVYGHLHGDKAITLVAQAIQAHQKEDWLAIRFGGDEFLVLVPDCNRDMAEEIKQGIFDYLERKNADGTRPYRISASCGYVLTNPKKTTDLQGYIKEADDMMYEIKKQLHARDGK